MRNLIAAALALTAASSLPAQTAAPAASANPDLSTATPIGGKWIYAPTADGSEASFVGPTGVTQISIRCVRVSRRVTISKPASAAAPFLWVWTSTGTRNLPASFNPATRQLSASLPAFDQFLDAIAFSRGRVGYSVQGTPPLVVPSWAEPAKAIEDCRV
jgi:hypothetical protein